MSKKKREHVVFDQMLKPKKNVPFSMVNQQMNKGKKQIDRKRFNQRKTMP